jgi:nitrogen regulatory protein P-II 1
MPREDRGEPVKRVEAIIKPFKLDEVKKALSELGVVGMTATDVKGFGRQRGRDELYRGAEYVADFAPKVKLEIAIVDAMLGRVLEALQNAARTGKIGDGKIFVQQLEDAVRVRTGERGDEAL